MEQWKQVDGYDRYFVSDLGRVKNIEDKILCLCPNQKGYYRVQLWRNNKKKCVFVHRLVAKAFIPNPDDHPQVNHKDCVKTNNRVENLEWCTNQQNSDHACAHGLKDGFNGEDHPCATITLQQAKEIRAAKLTKEFSRNDLAKKYGVSVHIVKDVRYGRTWNYA